MLRAFTIGAVAALAALGVAFAAGEAEPPEDYAFSFDSPLGGYEMGSVQRGFQIYTQVCSSCHALEHLSYRNLGEEGGPFAAYSVRNHETGAVETTTRRPEHGGRLVPVTDNPYVRAIAEAASVTDIDQETGMEMQRPARLSDKFRRPFANEAAARAANSGAVPPDLSVIVPARHGGADYVRSLLLGYTGETHGAQHVNRHFPGGLILMRPPLSDGAVVYEDAEVPQTVAQYATDLASFLQWAADPHMEQRKRTGLIVIGFLLVLASLLYLAYKQVWRGESH